MALVTIKNEDSPPTLQSAADLLGVTLADMDPEFGVVLIDPVRKLYSVRVNADRLPPDINLSETVSGPFADVPIGPLGDITKHKP